MTEREQKANEAAKECVATFLGLLNVKPTPKRLDTTLAFLKRFQEESFCVWYAEAIRQMNRADRAMH
jgi:hypothetical protein